MFHWGLPFTISYVAWIAMEIWISQRDRRKRAGVRQDGGSLGIIVVPMCLA